MLNAILLDSPGVNTTHLAIALGLEAISRGVGACLISAHDLVADVADLEKAERENRLERRMKVYMSPWFLMMDEIGYLLLNQLGATILFQLVTPRYEKGSRNGAKYAATQCWQQLYLIACCIARQR